MPTNKSDKHQQLLKKATEWFVAIRAETCSQEIHSNFQSWLDKSESHKQAYQEVERVWSSMDSLKNTVIPELNAARNSGPVKKIIAKPIAITLVMAVMSGFAWQDYQAPTYSFRTGLGEKKQFFLADTSSVTLNSNTNLEIHESWIRRQIYLLEGEAQFTVHHSWRPFIVSTDSLDIQDIGTIFNVRNRPESKSVTVIEGEVKLYNQKNWLGTHLKKGFSRHFTADGELLGSEHNDEQRAIGWLKGRLVFNHTPLNQVTAELERYHPIHFVFKTPGLAKQTISGNFETSDLNSFLQALSQIYGVHIHRNQQNIEISANS